MSADVDLRTLLIKVVGRDRGGVTFSLFETLAGHEVEVVDIEQIVIRGRLVLCVLITVGDRESELRECIQRWAVELDLDAEVIAGTGDNQPRRQGRSHVTVLGYPLRPATVAGVAGRIASVGGNIDRVRRLAKYPVTAIELEVSGADSDLLRRKLTAAAVDRQVDIAVQTAGLHRRAKRLVVMDVDSTLIQGEVIELLAERAGCLAEVARITEAAMRGELDFAESLRARVALLRGLEATTIEAVRQCLVLTPGARTLVRTLRRLGFELAIVSGGFTQITDALVEDLAIDHSAANTLEVIDGRLTGRLIGPILDRAGKASALRRFAAAAGVPISQTVAIGDGANDLDMLNIAGLGVAFNAKPIVQAAADAAVNAPFLDAILFLLGITREEVEAADAEDLIGDG